jgi:hypothetical protein
MHETRDSNADCRSERRRCVGRPTTSYAPVDIKESFSSIMSRMKGDKAKVEARQADLLKGRYDLSDRPPKASR